MILLSLIPKYLNKIDAEETDEEETDDEETDEEAKKASAAAKSKQFTTYTLKSRCTHKP